MHTRLFHSLRSVKLLQFHFAFISFSIFIQHIYVLCCVCNFCGASSLRRLGVLTENLYLPAFYYFHNFIFLAVFLLRLALFAVVFAWPTLKIRFGYVIRLKYKYVNVI